MVCDLSVHLCFPEFARWIAVSVTFSSSSFSTPSSFFLRPRSVLSDPVPFLSPPPRFSLLVASENDVPQLDQEVFLIAALDFFQRLPKSDQPEFLRVMGSFSELVVLCKQLSHGHATLPLVFHHDDSI